MGLCFYRGFWCQGALVLPFSKGRSGGGGAWRHWFIPIEWCRPTCQLYSKGVSDSMFSFLLQRPCFAACRLPTCTWCFLVLDTLLADTYRVGRIYLVSLTCNIFVASFWPYSSMKKHQVKTSFPFSLVQSTLGSWNTIHKNAVGWDAFYRDCCGLRCILHTLLSDTMAYVTWCVMFIYRHSFLRMFKVRATGWWEDVSHIFEPLHFQSFNNHVCSEPIELKRHLTLKK